MQDPKTTRLTIEDVDRTIKPLLAVPASWFEETCEQYYLATGGMGKITSLTPHTVTFGWVNNGDKQKYYPERQAKFAELVADSSRDVDLVESREAAEETGAKRVTWKTESSGQLFIYEQVAFDEPVTTPDSLKAELGEIMVSTPDFDEMFAEANECTN